MSEANLQIELYKRMNRQNRSVMPLETRKRIKERNMYNLYPSVASNGTLAREMRIAHARAVNRAKVLPTTTVRTNMFPRII